MSVDFDLNEEQRSFQAAVEAYLTDACPPQRLLSLFDRPDLIGEIWEGLQALGVLGVLVPEEQDGLGLGVLDAAVVTEVLGRFAAPSGFIEHVVGSACLAWCRDAELKANWLPRLAAGTSRVTLSFAGEGEDWSPGEWSLSPAKTLSATRRNVPWPSQMDIMLIGLSGGKLGLIDLAGPGVTVEPMASLDPTRPLATIVLDEAACTPIDADDALAWRLFDLWSILLAADAFGGASHCLGTTVAFAGERVQFGQPIGQFQAVKHQLADLALQIEPMAGLYWYAAHALDKYLPDSSIAAARAKAHVTEIYAESVRRSIELHGGIGYTWEFGIHVWLRRAIYDRQYLGTPARHRARVADLLGW